MPLEAEEFKRISRQNLSTQGLTVEEDMFPISGHAPRVGDMVLKPTLFIVGGAFVGLAVGGMAAQYMLGVETTTGMEILFAVIGAVLGSVSTRF